MSAPARDLTISHQPLAISPPQPLSQPSAKIMRLGRHELLVRQRLDAARFDVDDAVGLLHLALDDEGSLLRDEQPAFFKKFGRDDRIRDAGLVFEADEHDAFGRAGPLPADHVARDAHPRDPADHPRAPAPPPPTAPPAGAPRNNSAPRFPPAYAAHPCSTPRAL